MRVAAIQAVVLIVMNIFCPVQSYGQVPGTDSITLAHDSLKGQTVSETAFSPPVKAQKDSFHLYRVNYWVSGGFCILATTADIIAIPYIIKGKQDITVQELEGLNRNSLPAFDRWALDQDPSKRQMYLHYADYGLPLIIITPALLALDKHIKKDWVRILLMYYELHGITFSIYNFSFFGPAFENKYRPIVYYNQLPLADREPGNYRNSMYSGHVATAAASTFFMVKVYCDYHPEINQQKYLLYALATLPPLAIGYFRVKGMEHFPSDVMVGLTIGAACGVLVPEIHTFKNHNINVGLSSSPAGGMGFNLVWNMDAKSLEEKSRL